MFILVANGVTYRQTDDMLWHNRVLHSIAR